MIPGLRGSLLSHDALKPGNAPLHPDAAPAAHRLLAETYAQVQREGGPAWAARTVFDRIAVPFCRAFGLEPMPIGGDARACRALLQRGGTTTAVALAFPWGHDPATTWRDSVHGGIATGARWCFSFAGPALRIFDAHRTHSRRFVELDIATVCQDAATFSVAWSLLASSSGLDDAVRRSERHRSVVRESLQLGVHDALWHLTRGFAAAARSRPHGADITRSVFDESLIVVYRVLFLLFAEARGLVPAWHPVFRQSYTIAALREPVESLPRPRGVWEALQAIARLAHRGCRAGSLRVPPFNGRLFSPDDAPLADTIPLDDGAVRQALLALTTRPASGGRERIAYGDLGVEHLGGVYERVLDYDVAVDSKGQPSLVRGGRRRATGSFYTPRSLTEYVVRRTLAPLVENAAAEQILELRVLDPAMGSGAFLVAACRYLALAYEAALIRQGGLTGADLSDADRAGFRRMVAQRCLFGVDLNPMSVQLARLSLWLTTLAADRPLTFFDHHLRTGNSLIGAGVADVRQRRPGQRASTAPLPLLDLDPLNDVVRGAAASREKLRLGLEETLEQVRAKEKLFAQLQAEDSPLGRWKGIVDLWCAGWFDAGARTVNRATFDALLARAGGDAILPDAVAKEVLRRGRESARAHRFFHWELEFPEVFHAATGKPLDRPGFDAVIANPPWEMLRGDAGDAASRRKSSDAAAALTRFARGSGVYHLQGGGQANLYQMFVERALTLVRRGGRVGLVLPSGFATDHGCATLRRHVLDRTSVDSFVLVENREALFPIHRGLKFLLMTLTRDDRTNVVPVRAGIRAAAQFDCLPDTGPDPDAVPVPVTLIERLSGDQVAVPDLRSALDARIASQVAFSFPAAAAEDGWNLRFGRELNATDDCGYFNTSGRGLPVVEGKHIAPFTVDLRAVQRYIDPADAEGVLRGRTWEYRRVAYRDVAAATNKLTLIAAVLPAGAVTTHTLFCLKTPADEELQQYIAGMFNSLVANYIVRLRVGTHVTVAIIERLPLPKPERSVRDFRLVAECSRALEGNPADLEAQATLQASAARLYRLDAESFAHILSTFPLVDQRLRQAALARM